jgi:5'(3')-deoxyribonucleotidase
MSNVRSASDWQAEDVLTLRRNVRVGIDFDSTIARVDLPWLARLNALRGTAYRPEDWSDWNLSFLPEDDRSVFLSLLTPDLYLGVEPYAGAPDAIRRLSLEPHVELVCVTANPEVDDAEFTLAKKRWLQQHIPELADKLIIARTKSALGLDVLVDDAPHHFQSADYIPVLVDRPWNQSVNARHRFKTWYEGEELVRRLVAAVAAGTHERAEQLS